MIAAPIIAGALYRVRGLGHCRVVAADNAAHAIVRFAERIGGHRG